MPHRLCRLHRLRPLFVVWICMGRICTRHTGVGRRRRMADTHSLEVLLQRIWRNPTWLRTSSALDWMNRLRGWRRRGYSVRGGHLAGALIDHRRTMWLTARKLSRRPWTLYRLRYPLLLPCILLSSSLRGCILSLKTSQSRGPSNSSSRITCFDVISRLLLWSDNWRLRRRRRTTLCARRRG